MGGAEKRSIGDEAGGQNGRGDASGLKRALPYGRKYLAGKKRKRGNEHYRGVQNEIMLGQDGTGGGERHYCRARNVLPLAPADERPGQKRQPPDLHRPEMPVGLGQAVGGKKREESCGDRGQISGAEFSRKKEDHESREDGR